MLIRAPHKIKIHCSNLGWIVTFSPPVFAPHIYCSEFITEHLCAHDARDISYFIKTKI